MCVITFVYNMSVAANSSDDYFENEAKLSEDLNTIVFNQRSIDPKTNKKSCFYFRKYGDCKLGNNCNFIHSIPKFPVREQYSSESLIDKRAYNNEDSVSECSSSSLSNKNFKSERVCRYYERLGYCERENSCNFLHIDAKIYELKKSIKSLDISKKDNTPKISKNRSVPLCRHFKKGFCHKGDNCKFFHSIKKVISQEKGTYSRIPQINLNPLSSGLTQNVCTLSTASDEIASKMRSTEIIQMKKRFPQYKVLEEDKEFAIHFQPSDPDWAFDVKKLPLEIHFPDEYPLKVFQITVHQADQYIPDILIRHLNSSLNQWINERHKQNTASDKVEILFRPFLKWLDKNLEELFISGLKKVKRDIIAKESGIEFVPPEELFPSSNSAETEKSDEEVIPLNPSNSESFGTHTSTITVPEQASSNSIDSNGTKILFQNLELVENAAALTCTKLSIALHCIRCKTSLNTMCIPKKSYSYVCTKCSKDIGVTFESSLLHQFSNVLGYLHLLDCVPVDVNLVESLFLVDCLNCSKQVPTGGIHYGQKHKMWCQFCHGKIVLCIGSVKFQASKLLPIPLIKYAPAKKTQNKQKDPLMKQGEPLPNYGACKHYKKSFRWLRFPCCGRLYPCDECHDEVEDHEMKYASRMVCGYCAREQPYSRDKPCVHCSQDLTRKSGSHWEGGKGCRNRIKMSRDDKHKYTGVCKTVSRKADNAKPIKK